jgi:hypothetical protein
VGTLVVNVIPWDASEGLTETAARAEIRPADWLDAQAGLLIGRIGGAGMKSGHAPEGGTHV